VRAHGLYGIGVYKGSTCAWCGKGRTGHDHRHPQRRTRRRLGPRQGQHIYLPDADVAFEGGALTFVGRGYKGPAEEEISGRGLMVMPGLVNIHSHPSSEPMNKGLIDEIGSPGLYNSSLYEFMPIFRADAEAVPHCVRVALSELLLSGVTTLADLSMAHPGWLDLLAESGMRVCIAPMFRSARWFTKNGHVVEYEWDEAAGEKAMARRSR
jgi:5-methylthioadenosine/S-adenosylhomocysteine deaminase